MDKTKKKDRRKMSTKEKFYLMDKVSSEENWNHDFGTMIIDVFEKAIREGGARKTVKRLVDDLEYKFYKNRGD